jgi:hypothetical protein
MSSKIHPLKIIGNIVLAVHANGLRMRQFVSIVATNACLAGGELNLEHRDVRGSGVE